MYGTKGESDPSGSAQTRERVTPVPPGGFLPSRLVLGGLTLRWWLITKAIEDQSQPNQGVMVDLSWLDSVDPEIEQHLLPMERAILAALRSYRTIFGRNPTPSVRAPPRS